jgi:hypothetical protein
LSQEARYGKIRASKALANDAGERAAIREYLQYHPGSVEAVRLRQRLEQLAGK